KRKRCARESADRPLDAKPVRRNHHPSRRYRRDGGARVRAQPRERGQGTVHRTGGQDGVGTARTDQLRGSGKGPEAVISVIDPHHDRAIRRPVHFSAILPAQRRRSRHEHSHVESDADAARRRSGADSSLGHDPRRKQADRSRRPLSSYAASAFRPSQRQASVGARSSDHPRPCRTDDHGSISGKRRCAALRPSSLRLCPGRDDLRSTQTGSLPERPVARGRCVQDARRCRRDAASGAVVRRITRIPESYDQRQTVSRQLSVSRRSVDSRRGQGSRARRQCPDCGEWLRAADGAAVSPPNLDNSVWRKLFWLEVVAIALLTLALLFAVPSNRLRGAIVVVTAISLVFLWDVYKENQATDLMQPNAKIHRLVFGLGLIVTYAIGLVFALGHRWGTRSAVPQQAFPRDRQGPISN